MSEIEVDIRLEGGDEAEQAAFDECKVDFGLTDDLEGYMTAECPECGEHVKKMMRDMVPGASLVCGCGEMEITLSGDSLRDLQGSFDSLRKTLEDTFS